jgi:membrane-associated protease RseP (regulator of RpoE activity)
VSVSTYRTYFIHSVLFLLTFFTTTLAGVQWLNQDVFDLSNFAHGLPYSLCLLAVLASHEFGHYFAAKHHQIDVTLPYFIPIPPFLANPFGTMGAVIRIKSPLTRRSALFDVGIAGPIAGLVVTLGIFLFGITHLPPKEFLYTVHPDYRVLSELPEGGFTLGKSLLFNGLLQLADGHDFVPPMNEIYHYPYLCVGWFGMFVTALNLIPVGQLDGGHILYAITGPRVQGITARVFFGLLILIGAASLIPISGLKVQLGTTGWLLWAAILFFLVKLDHPEVADPEPLTEGRIALGWSTMLLFILMFPPVPFFI